MSSCPCSPPVIEQETRAERQTGDSAVNAKMQLWTRAKSISILLYTTPPLIRQRPRCHTIATLSRHLQFNCYFPRRFVRPPNRLVSFTLEWLKSIEMYYHGLTGKVVEIFENTCHIRYHPLYYVRPCPLIV
ncbi:unnamed protein product [Dicrocoelium dendriticum]|nr:unnamed protein product [Dicrocoelium dendriticum]